MTRLMETSTLYKNADDLLGDLLQFEELISDKTPLAIVLSADAPHEVARRALEAKDAGFRALKLKMSSGSEKSDIAIVKEVSAAAGDDIDIFKECFMIEQN